MENFLEVFCNAVRSGNEDRIMIQEQTYKYLGAPRNWGLKQAWDAAGCGEKRRALKYLKNVSARIS